MTRWTASAFLLLLLLLSNVARASYQPSMSLGTTVTPVDADGAYVMPAANATYLVTTGSADTVITFPAPSAGARVRIADAAGLADTYWISLEPTAGVALDPSLAADQHVLWPRAGAAMEFASDGSGWACSAGCEDAVIDPRNIPDLVAWYDAGRGLTLTAGRPITVQAWADQSGNGHTLANGASTAQYGTGPNGRPAIFCNGNCTQFRAAYSGFNARTITVATVHTTNTVSTWKALAAWDSGTTRGFMVQKGNTAGHMRMSAQWTRPSLGADALVYGWEEPTAVSQAQRTDSVQVSRLTVFRAGADGAYRSNGSTQYQVGLVNLDAAPAACVDCYIYVGQSHFNNTAGLDSWYGLIQTVLMFNGRVSDADTVRLERFLMRRWGIQP